MDSEPAVPHGRHRRRPARGRIALLGGLVLALLLAVGLVFLVWPGGSTPTGADGPAGT
jgi:hypothetical protein